MRFLVYFKDRFETVVYLDFGGLNRERPPELQRAEPLLLVRARQIWSLPGVDMG